MTDMTESSSLSIKNSSNIIEQLKLHDLSCDAAKQNIAYKKCSINTLCTILIPLHKRIVILIL